MNDDRRVALVGGANRGLGRETGRRLAALSVGRVGLIAAVALAAAAGHVSAARAQAPSNVCLGDPTASGVPKRAGPRLHFGITPAGEAGALGPMVPAVPDDPPRTLAALAALRPADGPFVLRLNRFFWSDGEAGIQRFLALVHRYTSNGYLVELQVRYHPPPGREGDVPGFVAFVREVVRRFGANPRVVGLQVTNEVNFTISPDSSDGAYAGARDALIQGVIAAKDEAHRRGFRHLTVGFNWFYRTDPNGEASFWGYLRDHGGPAFRAAVDWVGLDAYPGTVFPPTEPPGGERDGMVAAMSQLRRCFMPIAGLDAAVPIHAEENGWPTGPGRSEDMQAQTIDTMVRAVDDFRGTYNVTDYRWFDLRDHNTSSANFQHHYGLLRDDYSAKPAFVEFRRLVAELSPRGDLGSAPSPPGTGTQPRRPRLRLTLRYARGRCGSALAQVRGVDADLLLRVDFRVAGRRLAALPRVRRAPFSATVKVAGLRRGRAHRLSARAVLVDGRTRTVRRWLRVCPRRR
jgi:hypothetical protein